MPAQIAAILATVHRDPDSHPDPYTPADFLPSTSGRRPTPTAETPPENLLMKIEYLNTLFGGTDLRVSAPHEGEERS